MIEEVLPLAIIVAALCGAWLLLTYWWGWSAWIEARRLQRRAMQWRRPVAHDPAPGLQALQDAAPVLELINPATELDRDVLRRELMQAGMTGPLAYERFVLARLALTVVGGCVALAIHYRYLGVSLLMVTSMAAGMAGGYILARGYVKRRMKARQRILRRELPCLLDLMTVAIEGGTAPDAALREANANMQRSAPLMCAEVQVYLHQMDLGRPRRDALHDLGVRSGEASVTAFVSTLIQAHRFGTELASSLRHLSQQLRVTQRQQAEEHARQAGFMLIFPLVLFIFPGVFIVLVGPAGISIMRDMLAMNR